MSAAQRTARLGALALLATACTAAGEAYDYGPRLSQTSRIATHNSYFVNRGATGDWFATGVGERIADQLLLDRVRSLELDIHPDPAAAHQFRVYHTTPGDGVCDDLKTCLAPLRLLHDLVPSHSAVLVIIELKDLAAPTFDAAHTPEDLDAALRLELGDLLYTPAEYLLRCAAGSALAACARDHDWPYEGEVAGRVLVAVLGNWNDFPGAQAPADWARYATAVPIGDRVAFPMGSSWQRAHATLSAQNQALVTEAAWQAAWQQVALLQVEAWDDPLLLPALRDHQLVRADYVFTAADRAQATALGVQLWQTDWPWDAGRDAAALLPLPGAHTPSAQLDADGGVLAPVPAPGQTQTRVALGAETAHARIYAAASLGLADGVTACLGAALSGDSGQASAAEAQWCVHKHVAPKATPGKDAPADPLGETLTFSWRVCHAGGTCTAVEVAGDADAQVLDLACVDGACCLTPGWLGAGKVVSSIAALRTCLAGASVQPELVALWQDGRDFRDARVRWVGGVQAPLP